VQVGSITLSIFAKPFLIRDMHPSNACASIKARILSFIKQIYDVIRMDCKRSIKAVFSTPVKMAYNLCLLKIG
jgi:hypothetical protein